MPIFLHEGHSVQGITFPVDEHGQIRDRLEAGKMVSTIRVSNELGNYRKGQEVLTEWGDTLKVLSIQRLSSIAQYPYVKELPRETIIFLERFKKLDWIVLERIAKHKG
jgi:hypothetical protein